MLTKRSRGYTRGRDLCQGVKVSGIEVPSAGASETRCFHIGPVMMKYQAELWNDFLSGSTLLDGLPWSPLCSYSILAMGLERGAIWSTTTVLWAAASRRKSSLRIGISKSVSR